MTLKQARALAGTTTWASHSREHVEDALACVAAELTRLEQRHAAAVEAAYRMGFRAADEGVQQGDFRVYMREDAAWLASEAKARLT